MSILSAATNASPADAEMGRAFFVILFVFSAVAVTVAVRFGVFRAGSILGPKRLPDRGAAAMLLLSLFITLCVWLFVQQAYLERRQQQWKREGIQDAPKHLESLLTPRDMAFLSTVPPITGFLVMLGLGAFLGRGWLAGLGLRLRNLARGIAGGIVSFLVVGPLVFWTIVGLTITYQLIHFQHPSEHALLKSLGESTDRPSAILICFGAVLCAPLFEEMLFRGHLQTALRQAFMLWSARRNPARATPPEFLTEPTPPPGVLPYEPRPTGVGLQPAAWHGWAAVVLTSMVFAMFHPMWMWPPIFVLSLGLGYVYERTGNLWATVTMHCLFNSLETLQYLLILRGH